MSRTLIQKHSSSTVRALIERVNALSDLSHKLTKGELRELFVSNILDSFLTSQFSTSSGIVINQEGNESNQMDIIVYDNRILPPFIKEQNVGVFPAECVNAVIEVKSHLRGKDILDAEKSAEILYENVYSSIHNICPPLCAVIGFYGYGAKGLSKEDSGRDWLCNCISRLIAICLVDKYSWMKIDHDWNFKTNEGKINEETKRFIAVILDNIRKYSHSNFMRLSKHQDWLGAYIRDFT